MANGANEAQKKALFERLIAEGGDPKQAAEFSGHSPPEAAKGTGKEVAKATTQTKPNRKARSVPKPSVKMNASKAQKIIFGIMVGVTALTIFGDVLTGKAQAFDTVPRRMIGGSLAGIMLMLLAVPAPRLAVAFAVVAGAGGLFLTPGGKEVIDALTRLTGATPARISSGSTFVPPPITRGQPS